MKIDSHFDTNIGQKRDHNEDAVGVGNPPTASQVKQSGYLYVVADGLGGHQQGEKASQDMVRALTENYYKSPETPPQQRLEKIIKQVNLGLIDYSKKVLQPGEKTATTVVAAVVRQGRVLLANVGDSRAYLIRDGQATQLTRDHSYIGELVRTGAISEAEAQQSKYKNRLTRSVGSNPNLEVELYEPVLLEPGDILLMCSDGLSQYATRQDLEAAAFGSARDMVTRLIDFANKRGGSDNITVLVAKYGQKAAGLSRATQKKILIGLSVTLITLLAIITGWFLFNSGIISLPARATATPTVTPTSTSTATPESTATVTPTPTETLTPEPTVTPTLPPATLVDCEYTVQSGQYAGAIAELFDVGLDQVYRQNGSQDNLGSIFPNEILIIKGIPSETCQVNGGRPIVTSLPTEPTPAE